MSALFRFFVQYEILIYLILAVGVTFSFRSLWIGWREWRSAVFGLEKELSFQKVRIAGAFVLLFLMIALSQFCLLTFVVPFLPSSTFLSTPTVDLTQAPAAVTAGDMTSSPQVLPGTEGCLPGQLTISFPAPGSEVQGIITLQGIVDIPNFGFYKYEFAPQGTNQWVTIAAGNQPKTTASNDTNLGVWDTTALTPGDYQLRLLATDNLGNALPPCITSVRVVAP